MRNCWKQPSCNFLTNSQLPENLTALKVCKISKNKWRRMELAYSLEYVNVSLFCLPPVGIFLLKVNYWNTKITCKICSKLSIKASERRHCLVPLLLNSNRLQTLVWYFHCWLSKSKCQLSKTFLAFSANIYEVNFIAFCNVGYQKIELIWKSV